jgi:hypothetical protein
LTAATVGSTFDAASDIGVVNTGDIPVSLTSFTVSDTDGGGANYYLEQQMGLCIDGIYNGSLPAAFGTTPLGTPVSLALLATTTYGVDLYAGEAPTYCGHGDVVSTPLASDASGGSDTVTITANYTG